MKVRGHELHVERVGRGAPLYFLHGGPGLDHSYFRPFVEPLADGLELVFYDQLGCGRSARPDPLLGGIEGWAEELEALRRELGHGRISLLAHSFGVLIAATYALTYPEHLEAAVLTGAPSVFDFPGGFAQRRGIVAPALDDEGLRAFVRSKLPSFFHRYDPAVVERLDARLRYSGRANAYGTACLPTFNLRARRDRWVARTLIIAGGRDAITPTAGAQRLARSIDGARVATLDQSGHFPFIEEPEAFLELVRAYLAPPHDR
ncbi:MAG: alpha/beta fold hydrolase [Polyangiaceae bacterium]|nr:alpha/beta fold hydrolase [Polyangiaceae bacterium]MBK8936611.1 alpha/beta fold hydrolase [Polyangiaceae bacterium]